MGRFTRLITSASLFFVPLNDAFGVRGAVKVNLCSIESQSDIGIANPFQQSELTGVYKTRRQFFEDASSTFASSSILLFAPQIAAGADEEDEGRTRSNNNSYFCKPPKELSIKLADTRTQIDMAVQACSVQAWSSAAEMVNDPLLDRSALSALIDFSCDASIEDGKKQFAADVFDDIENMRTKLDGSETLSTEGAMAVMKYGTSARSGIDRIFGL